MYSVKVFWNSLCIDYQRINCTDNELLKVEDSADNFKKFQQHVFNKSEELDETGLNGRQLFDSSLKKMPHQNNDINTNLAFTSWLFFY